MIYHIKAIKIIQILQTPPPFVRGSDCLSAPSADVGFGIKELKTAALETPLCQFSSLLATPAFNACELSPQHLQTEPWADFACPVGCPYGSSTQNTCRSPENEGPLIPTIPFCLSRPNPPAMHGMGYRRNLSLSPLTWRAFKLHGRR